MNPSYEWYVGMPWNYIAQSKLFLFVTVSRKHVHSVLELKLAFLREKC